MRKHYIAIFAFLIILLIISGCANKENQTDKEQQYNNQNQSQKFQNSQQMKLDENFEEANSSDLEIGYNVLAMGSENSDGSIIADQIIFSSTEIDFENIVGSMRTQTNNNSDDQNINNQTHQPLDNTNNTRPNLEEMQNMPEEERINMIENMRAQRGEGGISNMRKSIIRLSGKLINKDETTITIELNDGGSKLIFYSDDTKILKSII